ncbi:MAG: TolC family protein [Rubricoccaceae bacterium]
MRSPLLFTLAALLTVPASAQTIEPDSTPRLPTNSERRTIVVPDRPTAELTVAAGAVTLSLDDAVAIALEQGYAIRTAQLDVANSRAQVREAYGSLMPRVDATSSYSRNVVQANPFAGSSAGNIFSGLGAIGWLQFNEQARTDNDPATEPISLTRYFERINEGQQAIGYTPADGSNPFGTDNSFQNTVSISQPLYSGVAFAAVKGARSLVEINEAAVEQREDEIVHQVRQAYFGALLAQEQLAVQAASATRARETSSDASLLVAQGVRPKLERLNAEVDLANSETQVVTAEAAAQSAIDRLLLTLGLPVTTAIRLEGDLDAPPDDLFQTVGLAASAEQALDERPDIRQAELAVQLQGVQRAITKAAMYPSVSAFANLSYNANVPDDRSFLSNPDPNDPFTFETGTTDFFSDAYWQPAVTVGLRLNWTLFDGFQTRYRAQQNRIAQQQAEIQLEQVRNNANLEVAAALRDLESARRRLGSQQQTVETAETAFVFASERLAEGVASQVDVRVASQNLDIARLNYLQSVFDALVARSNYERATGTIAPATNAPAPALPTTASR